MKLSGLVVASFALAIPLYAQAHSRHVIHFKTLPLNWHKYPCASDNVGSQLLSIPMPVPHVTVSSCLDRCGQRAFNLAGIKEKKCWCGVSQAGVVTTQSNATCLTDESSRIKLYIKHSLAVRAAKTTGTNKSKSTKTKMTTKMTSRKSTLATSTRPPIRNLQASTSTSSSVGMPTPTKCSGSPVGLAKPGDPYWLQGIKHQGLAPYHPGGSSQYSVFRNVKDFGAKGDGVTDDTAAINAAIQSGNRCGANCVGSTTSPALVFFPTGTYLVSAPLLAIFQTHLVGDARRLPTLLAAAKFSGVAVIDANPSVNGQDYYFNTVSFFRAVRNLIIDLRRIPSSSLATGIHWEVSQATSLNNIRVEMSRSSDTNHRGLYMEGGSGGLMSDIIFNGGAYGMYVGNQQFTVRNVTVNYARVALHFMWTWGWTFQHTTISNCGIGFEITSQSRVEGLSIVDAIVYNTPVFVSYKASTNGKFPGSLVLKNIQLFNVPTAIAAAGSVLLRGGTTKIGAWAQGKVYSGTSTSGRYQQGGITIPARAAPLLDPRGYIYSRKRPQYHDFAPSQIASARSLGAKGDGITDDTTAIQTIFDKYSSCYVIFFDAGIHRVTDTIRIPPGAKIVGESWSVIAGSGSAFQNETNPRVVVQVGTPGSKGAVEITDIIFSTIGPAAGAIVVEWNMGQTSQGSAGMWDSHLILGGFAGSNLQYSQCPSGSILPEQCAAAFMGMHLTKDSSAYMEGTWVWLADHDNEDLNGVTLFSGRGILSESQGPVWMIGTASEHHVLYQYALVGAKNHYMGSIQGETPYYQPAPAAPAPVSLRSDYHDPIFGSEQTSAWALYIEQSKGIYVFGAGLYSFFINYVAQCHNPRNCQTQSVSIGSGSQVTIANLNTVGTTYQLSVDRNPIVLSSANANSFVDTLTIWTST